MTYAVFFLMEFGLSEANATLLSENGIMIIDLFNLDLLKISEKQIYRAAKRGNQILINKNPNLSINIFDSLYNLRAEGLSKNAIERLKYLGIKNVSQLASLTEADYYELTGRKQKSMFNKIKEAYYSYTTNLLKSNELKQIADFLSIPQEDFKNEVASLFTDTELDEVNEKKKFLVTEDISYKPISLYVLLDTDVSTSAIDDIRKEGITLTDVIFRSHKIYKLSTTLQKKVSTILKNIETSDLNKIRLDSINLLYGFGLNKQDILNIQSKRIRSLTNLMNIYKEGKKIGRKIEISLIKAEHFKEEIKSEMLSFIIISILSSMRQATSQEIFRQMLQKDENIKYSIEDIKKNLNELVREGYLNKSENMYSLKILTLNDFLNFNFLNRGLFIDRLNGLSLEEIGNKKELTRERIRQRLNDTFSILTKFSEDKYKKIFEEYRLSQSEFQLLFNESELTYNYLNIRYKKGNRDKRELVEDYSIPRVAVIRYLNSINKFLSTTGEVKHLKRSTVFDEVCFKNPEKHTVESIKPLFKKEAEELGLPDYQSTNFLSVIQNSKTIIESVNGQFRYYDFSKIDKHLLSKIKSAFEIPDGVYGANYFFDKNSELLEELELLDGYEFLDLSRKLNLINNSRLSKIERRTEAYVGNIDKKDFIENLMKENNGLNIYEFCDQVELEFGLKASSLASYLGSNFDDLILNQDIFIVENTSIDKKTLNDVKNIMTETIYTKNEYKEIIRKSSGFIEEPFSKTTLNYLGYKLSGEIIYKQDKNLKSAIKKDILAKNIVDIREYNNLRQGSVNNAFKELQEDFKIFRYEEYKYMSNSFMEQNGVSQELIKDFIFNANSFIGDNQYLTIYSLIESGFNHDLLDLGFPDIFYEELLWLSGEYRKMNTSLQILAKRPAENSLKSFILHFIRDNNVIDEEDLIDDINTQYGFKINIDKIRNILITSGFFYSKELNKYFLDENDYYREVYGE